jgi:hypothetical protein
VDTRLLIGLHLAGSPLRAIVLTIGAVIVTVTLAYRAQWNTSGDPLVPWNRLPPSPPSRDLRQWFVRRSPLFVGIGLAMILIAILLLH